MSVIFDRGLADDLAIAAGMQIGRPSRRTSDKARGNSR